MVGKHNSSKLAEDNKKTTRLKSILVISVGLSPQVVTETLYALVCERKVPIDEVYMWTTTEGARVIQRDLLDDGRGALYRLFDDYEIPLPTLHTKVFGSTRDAPFGMQLANDRPLDDIRSGSDNELVADTLVQFFREQTADPTRRILCSLAGARKTIGPYLALALQFFGRPGDRLFHVLVPPHLEADRTFFYPSPESPPGLIQLIDVPVAMLREHFDLLRSPQGPQSYSDLVQEVQLELAYLMNPPVLEVRRGKELEIVIGPLSVRLPPLPLVLYTALAGRRVRCSPACDGCPECFITLSEIQDADVHETLLKIVRIGGFKDYRLQTLPRWSKTGSTVEQRVAAYSETVSRINRVIGDRPGMQVFRVIKRRWGEQSGYGIALAPDRIKVPTEIVQAWTSN